MDRSLLYRASICLATQHTHTHTAASVEVFSISNLMFDVESHFRSHSIACVSVYAKCSSGTNAQSTNFDDSVYMLNWTKFITFDSSHSRRRTDTDICRHIPRPTSNRTYTVVSSVCTQNIRLPSIFASSENCVYVYVMWFYRFVVILYTMPTERRRRRRPSSSALMMSVCVILYGRVCATCVHKCVCVAFFRTWQQ